MKLYSRGQTVFYSIATGLLVLLFAYGLGLIGGSGGDSGEPGAAGTAEEGAGNAGQGEAPGGGAVMELQTNSREIGREAGYDGNRFTEEELENIRLYENRNPGVVNITTEVMAYNWFLEPVPREGGSGSGSIIDSRGYILTNHHVVEKAYKVNVTLADGTQFQGEVIGTDPENDLAVIKFDPGAKELVTIPFGTSEGIRVGQKVLAIGNPFALERTLTTGIVSGLGRPVKNSAGMVIREMIQTDASINPGNSGGPLFNSQGKMIGINTMIYSPSGGSVGIGFAVPVDTAKRVIPDLIEHGRVVRGWIDITPVQLFPSLVRYADIPVKAGLLVSRVARGGKAEAAGLRGGDRGKAVRTSSGVIYLGGDIIVGVDGMEVKSLSDLYSALEDNRPGETVPVRIIREGKEKTLNVELVNRPQENQWD